MLRSILLVSCVLMGSLFVSAAAVDGEWSFTATSSGGQQYYLTLTLNEVDGKIVGTLGNENGGIPLDNVKLQGDQLSFEITTPDGVTYSSSLTVDGDAMKGSYKGSDGNSGTVSAKRKSSQ